MTDKKRPAPPSQAPPSARTPAMPVTEDERFMDQALALAKGGRPSPNPHVGAIVVLNGEIVGSGHHEKAGGEHAELVAIRAAGAKAKGATLYVTLEPCNHHGRTPPCTEAILGAGISRVVVGVRDPNPHVDGKGIERLREAGVDVVSGVREAQALKQIAAFAKHITTGMPYVALKLALSLDGRIATRSGASKWVTGADARAKVHYLRSRSDAIAIGIGTALADDPRLTVRDTPGASPTRLVFDTKLRLPTDGRLVMTAHEVPTWVLCGTDASEAAEETLLGFGVEVIRLPMSTEGRLDMPTALRMLAARGIVTLMVEGGAELAGSFLAGRFADELHCFVAPILLGPRGRPGAVDWAGPDTPQQAPRIATPAWELVGADAYVHGAIVYPD